MALIAQTPGGPARTRGSVFIIEDDEPLLDALSTVLTDHGYSVRSGRDGREALAKLDQGPVPDVILMDLMMPEMSGWEFRVEQRKHPQVASVAVVAMSGDDSAKARAVDAQAYLSKPVDLQTLVTTIERVIVQAERARLRVQSAEIDRLRSLGLLAAGIAHEINNPLAVVVGTNAIALQKCDELAALAGDKGALAIAMLRQYHDRMDQALGRIASVVQGIATFSRPTDLNPVAIDVGEVLDSTIRLFSNEIRHHARLVLALAPVPPVLGNPSELGQVFLNLLANAVHAMPDGATNENTIRVSMACEVEGRVTVTVEDTGSGIPPEVAPRIFDPFFTTKPIGKGMGLGLSLSRTIVESMGGVISFTSERGKGTAFRVELPAHSVPAPLTPKATISEPQPQVPQTVTQPSRRRVLVIDDEPMMCDLLDAMLRDTCDVVALTSGRTALDRISAGESFDLILCDLMMPDLTGMDVYDELKKHNRELAERIVFMTGGAFSSRASAFLDGVRTEVLHKPFRAEHLLSVIEHHASHAPSIN